jgi:hypothetical protein
MLSGCVKFFEVFPGSARTLRMGVGMIYEMWDCEFPGEIAIELELDALPNHRKDSFFDKFFAILAPMVQLRETLKRPRHRACNFQGKRLLKATSSDNSALLASDDQPTISKRASGIDVSIQ